MMVRMAVRQNRVRMRTPYNSAQRCSRLGTWRSFSGHYRHRGYPGRWTIQLYPPGRTGRTHTATRPWTLHTPWGAWWSSGMRYCNSLSSRYTMDCSSASPSQSPHSIDGPDSPRPWFAACYAASFLCTLTTAPFKIGHQRGCRDNHRSLSSWNCSVHLGHQRRHSHAQVREASRDYT